MRIYLADLSHDTVGLATEVFPLNVGYIAAYAKEKFKDRVDVRLFKYIDELDNAIDNDPPDILALSNYPWCERIGLAMFENFAKKKPEGIRVMGGPNFPHELSAQKKFLNERPLIDIYTYLDGEVSFSNIVEFIFNCEDLVEARQKLKTYPVNGCVHVGENGEILAPALPNRISDLDEIPSPYLTGLLDQFFDGRLSPMIQTHRGCPFTCTFCADGTSLVNKVYRFSTERTIQELQYIGERVSKSMRSLHIADLNFGMFARDVEICEFLKELKEKYNYPLYIDTATGKNSKKRIINAIEKLDGVLAMIMSVQSMTPAVLKNIKRENIRLDDFIDLKHAIKSANLPTSSEIILGLPGETKTSHLDSLNQLMISEIENITPYTLMMLNGSEMATIKERKKWGFKTKFRVLPRDFTKLSNGKKIVEIEEVVVETKTLPYEDYVYCRKIALLIAIFNTAGFKTVIKILVQNNIDPIDLFILMLTRLEDSALVDNHQRKELTFMCDYERDTRGELWKSEDDVINFFEDDKKFDGLIDGTYGANLIQTYRALCYTECLKEFSQIFYNCAKEILHKKNKNKKLDILMSEAILYSKGLIWNILGTNRLDVTPIAKLNFDFKKWVSDPDEKELMNYSFKAASEVTFSLSQEQYKLVEDSLDRFGRTSLGIGKALLRLNYNVLWRSPDLNNKTKNNFTDSKTIYLN